MPSSQLRTEVALGRGLLHSHEIVVRAVACIACSPSAHVKIVPDTRRRRYRPVGPVAFTETGTVSSDGPIGAASAVTAQATA